MVNKYESSRNIEQVEFEKVEHKYQILTGENFPELRETASPIEQVLLSDVDEPFELNLCEKFDNNYKLTHTATLQAHNHATIETQISDDVYDYYKSLDYPCQKKLRAQIDDNLSADFYEDGNVIINANDENAWKQFQHETDVSFAEFSSDSQHVESRMEHPPKDTLDVNSIISSALSQVIHSGHSIVQIAGRSGSGKSTIARKIKSNLELLDIESEIMSTDDYNRGQTWLSNYNHNQPWTQFDHPIVYDTKTMSEDLQKLMFGQTIQRRTFDFNIQEPVFNDPIEPTPVTIVEGIYAMSPDLANLNGVCYEMPTPLATCVGRRIFRDIKDRAAFADPAINLAYILEQAEPMYRKQKL